MKWTKPSDKLPENSQMCLLLALDQAVVCGPIMWVEYSHMWVDLFATPEAGEAIKADQVSYWIDWNEIKPEGEA